MKIALAQLNYHIGNFEHNTRKIKQAIGEARERGADLILFPELAVCGYSPQDLLDFEEFIGKCSAAIDEIAAECRGIAAIVGSPSRNMEKGKSLFNSAFFLADGEIKQVTSKALLPTYDVFDEYRYFEPDSSPKIIEYKGFRFALTICEDLWNLGDHPLYKACPMDELVKGAPDIMLNIAASPFSYEQQAQRRHILNQNVSKYRLPLFYVNHVGAHTGLVFDGGSLVIGADGQLLDELSYFKEDLKIYTISGERGKLGVSRTESSAANLPASKIEFIYQALVLGIRDYFGKMGFKNAILGLSGGIDSAVVLCLAAEALGAGNVRALLLPSQFSSDHSIKDAVDLAKNLGVNYDTIEIEPVFKQYEAALTPFFSGLPFNVAEENLQARVRGVLLMAMSNKFGDILLNTTNKSEMAVGYGTLYGDMCGGLSVIGDVYKTDVYNLARYINKDAELIPENSIVKPPSAELKPGQKDSDSLPDYDTLDKILYRYIEENKSTREIIEMGFDEAVVKKAARLVSMNEYKRFQAAPVIRVSPKAFGNGRRMPIVARYEV